MYVILRRNEARQSPCHHHKVRMSADVWLIIVLDIIMFHRFAVGLGLFAVKVNYFHTTFT